MAITLMSYNVQHCRNFVTEQVDYDAVADTIRRHNADIIGLNEIFVGGPDSEFGSQITELAGRLGYNYYFARAIHLDRANSDYGNALLSKYPIVSTETIPIPDPAERANPEGYYETRCLLKAQIDVDGSTLQVCATHFGLNIDEQENAVNTVLENVSAEKCVLMGDFNIYPDNPLLVPIREKMYDTAALFPEEKLSWPSDKPTVKIDYVFTSPDLKIISADIPAEMASDHRPYVIIIDL